MEFSKLGNDKVQHTVAGTLIALVLCTVALLIGISLHYGVVITILIAIGKELYDKTGKGTPEWQDAYCTVCGGMLGFYLINLFS